MPTRNIHLTAEMHSFISDRISTGKYSNASEVVRAGLRALGQDEAEDQAKLEYLRSAIQNGLKGPFHDGPSVMDGMDRYIDRLAAERKHSA